MDCCDVRRKLSAHYDGEMPSERAKRVARHLNQCYGCWLEFESFRCLSDLIRLMVLDETPAEVWEGVERKLANRRDGAI